VGRAARMGDDTFVKKKVTFPLRLIKQYAINVHEGEKL
jgi:hypothetical protein